MTAAPFPDCPRCHEPMVLEMDPASPPDSQSQVLLADPPFHFVCVSGSCSSATTPREEVIP
jgi:hypothetical protein